MLKKIILIFWMLPVFVFAETKGSFFLQNRYGILVKVDPGSAYKGNYAVKKGPRLDEIPTDMTAQDFNIFFSRLDPAEKNIINQFYQQNTEGNYQLTEGKEDLSALKQIQEIFNRNNFFIDITPEMKAGFFEQQILSKVNTDDKTTLMNLYQLSPDKKKYKLDLNWNILTNLNSVRSIFLKYNHDNEIQNGLKQIGSPMPHRFPRVHQPETKANFDIHIAWGVRIENDAIPGALTVGFSLNITNFTMFSLEVINLKYNFNLPGYPFEPYIGGTIYGGYLDGFPIGINLLGGIDVFPMATNPDPAINNKKFYISGEIRLGPVIYVPVYYDTGLNTETIYKKLGILMEGGFYFGYGYIWKK